jgi:hypothetical protein
MYQGMKIFLATPDDLLGGVGQMEAHFDPFGDSINVHTKLVHGLRRTCNRLKSCFRRTGWNS